YAGGIARTVVVHRDGVCEVASLHGGRRSGVGQGKVGRGVDPGRVGGRVVAQGRVGSAAADRGRVAQQRVFRDIGVHQSHEGEGGRGAGGQGTDSIVDHIAGAVQREGRTSRLALRHER